MSKILGIDLDAFRGTVRAMSGKDVEKLAALEEEASRIKKATDLLQKKVEQAQIAQVSEDVAQS